MKKLRIPSIFLGTLPLFVLAHFGHHLLTALPTPMLPLIRNDFNLSYAQSGMVASAFGIAYGISQLPAGWLADRISYRFLIVIGTCGVAVAGLLVGLSTSFVTLIVFLVLMGIAGGGYHPSAAPLIGASTEPEKRGRALGFHLIGGSGSFFLSPLIAAAIASVWGWRGAFIGLAVPTTIFGIVFYVMLRRFVAAGKGMEPIAQQPADGQTPSGQGRLRQLIAFLVLNSAVQAIFVSVMTFIPLYMVDNFHISEAVAAASLSIIHSAGLWAAPLGGYISDRIGKVQVMLASCFITGPLIYLLNVAPYGVAFGALLLFLGACMSMRAPTAEAYLVNETPEKYRSTIFGIYYFAGMEVGALLTPAMGALIDRVGFTTGYTIASVSAFAITVVCSVFLRRQR